MANGARVAEVPIQYRQRIGKKAQVLARRLHSIQNDLPRLPPQPTLPLTLAGALLTAPGTTYWAPSP